MNFHKFVEYFGDGIMFWIPPNVHTTLDTLISTNDEYLIKTPATCLLFHNSIPNYLIAPTSTQVDNYESEIFEDILAWILKEEMRLADVTSLAWRTNCTAAQRATVLNWLMKVQFTYDLSSEIYFATVKLFDYLLIFFQIPTNMLQLAALTVLWICCKYESRRKIMIEVLVQICDRVYSHRQFIMMEKIVLRFYNFSVDASSLTTIMQYYFHLLGFPNRDDMRYVAEYFMHCFTLSKHSSKYYPSFVAAGAVYLAVDLIGKIKDFWKTVHLKLGFYSEAIVARLARRMIAIVKRAQASDSPYLQAYLNFVIEEKMAVSDVVEKLLL